VVVVPILAKGNVQDVSDKAKELRDALKAAGIRVVLDESDERPGAKFFKWELKGVPLRLELGARDIEKGVVAYARRDDGKKGSFARAEVVAAVRAMLDQIAGDMRAKAQKFMDDSIITVDSLDLKEVPEKWLRFGWCGEQECGRKIEERTELKILGSPYVKEEFHGKCLGCGKDTDIVVYAARAM
jgi:prolyl-tRNA synthetase